MYKEMLYKILDNVQGNKITILPHHSVDVDAAISCIFLSKLFDFLEVENQICIFDNTISKDTDGIMKSLGYDLRKFYETKGDEERKIFLVDHYESKHSGEVIGVIDHHLTLSQVHAKVYIFKESCATAYIIYELMLAAGMPINEHIIKLLAYAMLVDTCAFKSSKTVIFEKENVERLIKTYGLNYDEMIKNSFALTDIENMEVSEIIENGLKDYTFSNHNVKSSYIQIKGTLEDNLMSKVMYKLCDTVNELDIELWVFIIFDMENDKTHIYYISKDGNMYEEEFIYILSRGRDIIPRVEEYYYTS